VRKRLWISLLVGILASPTINANESEKTIFYDDFVPLCTIFGGRMSRSNDTTAEQIFTSCNCVNDYIIENNITHEGLRVDLSIGVFSKMEYYLKRDGLSAEEQFHHITEVIQRCPID